MAASASSLLERSGAMPSAAGSRPPPQGERRREHICFAGGAVSRPMQTRCHRARKSHILLLLLLPASENERWVRKYQLVVINLV